MKTLHTKHSFFFRVVSTLVFLLVLLNTIAMAYQSQDDPISQILTTLENIFFGTTSTSSSSSGGGSQDSTITATDPSTNPPPPPPPK